MDDFFRFSKKIWFLGILGPPYCGIGATIRIGREMLCLPYAGFLIIYLSTLEYNGAGFGIIRNGEESQQCIPYAGIFNRPGVAGAVL